MDRFKEPDEREVDEYSTCSGCTETIFEGEEDVLDVYGMCVHNDFQCLKKAVDAKLVYTIKDR